jgi:hypothetical protein
MAMLAWIAPAHAVLNIWVREIDKPAATARAITADPKRGIRDFFWQYDSKHVIYLQDHDGDENWHLYQVPVSGSQVRDLTPGKLQARILAHYPDFPDHVVIALNERDARFHDAYLLDLNTVEPKLVAQNPGDIEYYIADKKLRVRAALARLKDGSAEIRVRDDEQSPWRRLTGWSADDVDGELLAFSADDRAVWYTSSAEADTGRLLETDVATSRTRVRAADRANQFDAGQNRPTSHETHTRRCAVQSRA